MLSRHFYFREILQNALASDFIFILKISGVEEILQKE